jgi:hypothetical protein
MWMPYGQPQTRTLLRPAPIRRSMVSLGGTPRRPCGARHDVFRAYNDLVFGRFWRRELDPESVDALTAVMAEIGAPPDFASFLAGEGGAEHDRLRNEAEASGVFGGADLRFRRRAVLGRRPDRPVARAAGREGGETPARLTTICRRSP